MKYADDIAKIANCPPARVVSEDVVLFRFVQAAPDHRNNSLPGVKINPRRALPGSPNPACADFALSFFDTIENARSAYAYLSKRFGNFSKTAGSHLAMVDVTIDDGFLSQADKQGHRNLYEFAGVLWTGRFTIIQALGISQQGQMMAGGEN